MNLLQTCRSREHPNDFLLIANTYACTMPLLNFLWLHFLNNRSPIQSPSNSQQFLFQLWKGICLSSRNISNNNNHNNSRLKNPTVSSHMITSLFSLPSGNFREDIFVRSAVISPFKRNVHLNDSRIVQS